MAGRILTDSMPSVAVLGSGSKLTAIVLEALVDAGIRVDLFGTAAEGAGRVRYAPDLVEPSAVRSQSIRIDYESIVPTAIAIADRQRIPHVDIWSWRELGDRLRSEGTDCIVTACFPRILPRRVLRAAAFPGLNVHPSLLPEARGPAPLFWTFRRGARRAGVTVHVLSSRVDAGDIVAQKSIPLEDGMRCHEVDALTSECGAELLIEALSQMGRGRLDRRRQDESRATRAPWPSLADMEVHRSAPARWAFNFVRGVAESVGPLTVWVEDRHWLVEDALDWGHNGHPELTGLEPYYQRGKLVRVQFDPGWVLFRVK